jgi:hypothetical protein
MLLSVPYVYFLVPETKGIPLEDVNSLFRKGLRPWKAHPVVLAEIRQRHEVEVHNISEDADVKRSTYHEDV